MRLLVSVASAAEAVAALAGGADIIDAKDPTRGALGPVSLPVLDEIRDACGGAVPVTAALGEVVTAMAIERDAAAFARARPSLIKVGFAAAGSLADIVDAIDAAIRGVRTTHAETGVVAVAYADAAVGSYAGPDDVLTASERARPAGVLLDTLHKDGPGLRSLMSIAQIRRWVDSAHRAGLMAAVAGKLSADDIDWLGLTGVDVVGVRGAACEAGRESPVSASRVSHLRARCEAALQHGRRQA